MELPAGSIYRASQLGTSALGREEGAEGERKPRGSRRKQLAKETSGRMLRDKAHS